MAKTNKETKGQEKRKSSPVGYFLTPFLLLALCGGMAVLCYSLAPVHNLQRYLNLAFMDTLKVSSSTSGLNIKHRDIQTEPDPAEPDKPKYETGKINYPTFGERYAMLEAKSINLKVGVYYGVNSDLLALGACQPTQSTILGEVGNHVIDAHVNTFFAELHNLAVGDEITMFTDYGKFTYEVTQKIEFNKSDKKYVGVTKDDCLTLYTCAPQVIGNSDLRIGVRCALKDKEFYQPEEG